MRRLGRIFRRWLLWVILLGALWYVGSQVVALFTSYQYDADFAKQDLVVTPDLPSDAINIALFGVDTRTVDIGTRADAILVLSLSSDGKSKLVSLMRDSKVPIKGHGQEKLAHAFAYGGPALMISTINHNYGLNITDYISVDFAQMKKLVDIVGGVWVDVSENEQREANRFILAYQKEKGVPKDERTPITQTGYQHLNGVQALCYARIRKGGTGDDWGRVSRQNEVLRAMLEQVKAQSPTKQWEILKQLLQEVSTSIAPLQMAKLAVRAVRGGLSAPEHIHIPLDSTWHYSPKGGTINFDLEDAKKDLYAFLYPKEQP